MKIYPIREIEANPTQEGFARMIPDVTFTKRERDELQMQILQPWALTDEEGNDRLYPAVVFVQGSGWTFPQVHFEIPQLSQLARQGYVVATITHRNLEDGHRAPAYLEDVKTAIRFLRAHSEDLHIDPKRLGIWGTSSGANAALLAALTIDDPKYKTDEWPEETDAVNFVVDCFAPVDTMKLVKRFEVAVNTAKESLTKLSIEEQEEQTKALASLKTNLQNFVGSPDGSVDMALVRELSPLERIDIRKTYPPVLILHGDQDHLVECEQSLKLYEAFKDHGTEVEMIRVIGGEHEGNFWSQEVLDAIWEFIARHS